MNIYTFSPFGYEGSLVNVECDVRDGIPALDVIGLADGAVKESRERTRSAIINSGLDFPNERVLLSLSPADLKKEGAGFDLPIALSILNAKLVAEGNSKISEDIFVIGELELSGNVRSVNGVYAGLKCAVLAGIKKAIVPIGNLNEALSVEGIEVIGVVDLKEAYTAIEKGFTGVVRNNSYTDDEDFEEISGVFFPKLEEERKKFVGNKDAVEALKIAIAGGHNAMFIGGYGCGKTMVASYGEALQPMLDQNESQTVTRIYSLAGLTKYGDKMIKRRPFRMPHQTASIEGICGGGPNCRPGEITLAHNGILYFDDAMEFRSSVLQILRVPLESGCVTLSRAGRSTTYPAKFQFIATCQPCPCGNFGSKEKVCLCSSKAVEVYWKKFSAPLIDRIPIRVECKKGSEVFVTNELRSEIAIAYKKQIERQRKRNADLTPNEVEDIYTESGATESLSIMKSTGYTSRKMYNILKTALTIADLKNHSVCKADIIEAEKLHNVVPFEA